MKRFARGRQYVNILLTLLLALSPLETVAQCIDATDSAGNVYCGGLCTGVNCSIRMHSDTLLGNCYWQRFLKSGVCFARFVCCFGHAQH